MTPFDAMMRRTRSCSTSRHPSHWHAHIPIQRSDVVSTEPHIEHQMGGVLGALSSGGCFTLVPHLAPERLSSLECPSRLMCTSGTAWGVLGSVDTTCGRNGDMRPLKS